MRDNLYKHIIEESPNGCAVYRIIYNEKDVPYDYEFIEINSAFERFTGLEGIDILGKRFSEIFPKSTDTKINWIEIFDDIAIYGGSKEVEGFSQALDRWFRVKVYSPEKYYIVTYLVDVSKEMRQFTELENLQETYKETEFKYKTIADFAYDWETWEDGVGKFKYVSPACERISGYTVEEFVEDESLFASLIIEEDKELWLNHRHEIGFDVGAHTEQFRIRHKDGKIVWIEHACRPVVDCKGAYLGYRANNRDISKRKQAEEALKRSEEKYRLLTENASDVIWVLNLTQNKFTYISPSVFHLRGFTAEQAINQTLEDALTPESLMFVRKAAPRYMREFLENSNDPNHYIQEIQQPCKNGEIIWVEISAKYRYNSVGEIEIVGVSRSIEERKKSERKVLYLSYHDQLTGLYNRRFYEEELKRLDTERNLPITLVMSDVNGLKLTNDAFGHLAGDELLKNFATLLLKGSRGNDTVARTGGDEFVLLLPGTTSLQAEKMVNRIKSAIDREKTDKTILSVSFGWATKDDINQDINNIFMQAEDSMYRKKLFESTSMKSKTIKLITKTLCENNAREQQHCERVSKLCKDIGTALGLSLDVVDELGLLGLLHDIGKIGMNEKILNKPEKLEDVEWVEIKRHPEIGYQILRSVNEFAQIAEYVLSHHERLDGEGYPRNLKDSQIPLPSKILSIADAYDAMTSDFSYKTVLNKAEAIKELEVHAGTQFDAEIVKIFVEKVLCTEWNMEVK